MLPQARPAGVILLLILTVSGSASRELLKAGKGATETSAGRLLLTLSKKGATITHGGSTSSLNALSSSIASAAGTESVKILKHLDVAIVETGDMSLTTSALGANVNVERVSPDSTVQIAGIPNDEEWGTLWGMDKVEAPAAWDITTGSRDVVVCVIDTGVDYLHPDLINQMWTNPGEIPGNGIDDDDNGYVDDVYGINAVTGSGDPMDDNMHGTHCAGTVGAQGNNTLGVVGVAPEVSIMACKFLTASGSGSISDALVCLDYAVGMGVPISSNSWGGGGFDPVFETALDNAGLAGHLFIAAAGNDARDNDVTPSYPASYIPPTMDAVMSIASVAENDMLSSFSQWGSTSVDLAAPGSNINSCAASVIGGGYTSISGTSMATPHVAGAAALLLAYNPAVTNLQMKQTLIDTCTGAPPLEGFMVSGGILNVRAALTGETPDPIELPDPSQAELFTSSNTFDLSGSTVTFSSSDYDTPCTKNEVEQFPSGGVELSLADDGWAEVGFTNGFEFTFFGVSYDRVFVGSNGYLTFGQGDTEWRTSLANHNRLPRVSVLYNDMSPDEESTVSYVQTAEMFVVTYNNIKQFDQDDRRSTFQVALMRDGSISMSYPEVVNGNDIIVGLSNGGYSLARDLSLSDCADSEEPFPDTPTPAWEMFWPSRPFDLAGSTLTFSQEANYRPCRSLWTEPSYPNGPSAIAAEVSVSDDESEYVTFTGDFVFPFFGQEYAGVYVGSNGYLTFALPDGSFAPSAKNHNSQPRVSALYMDLVPDQQSNIFVEQLADAFVVTYNNIKKFGEDNLRSNFQVMLTSEGSVSITYLSVASDGAALVGLSSGDAEIALETDLSDFGDCVAPPPENILRCAAETPLQMQWLAEGVIATCPSSGQSYTCIDGYFMVQREEDELVATCTMPDP